MNFLRKTWVLCAAVALGALAWRAGGFKGLLLLASALVMWALLYFNRVMAVMRRANDRPVGYVASAVMLNARLHAGQTLLHVLALTRALGERLSAPDAAPETYRWRDAGGSAVTADFENGRLVRWRLDRPPEADEAANPADAAHACDSAINGGANGAGDSADDGAGDAGAAAAAAPAADVRNA